MSKKTMSKKTTPKKTLSKKTMSKKTMSKKTMKKKATKKKATKKKAITGAAPTKARLVRERDALRKLLDDKLDELRKLRQRGAATWDRQWEIVGEILEADPPLWQGRYNSETKFVAAELPDHDRRSVRRNVLVAGAFRPRDIERHPIGLLEELALFVKERSGMTERPRALDLSRISVDVPDGRSTTRVRGDRVTPEQLGAARKALGRKKPKRADGPRAAAVRKIVARRKSLAAVTLRLTEDHATFSRVPLEQLAALGAVLSDLSLPTREGPS